MPEQLNYIYMEKRTEDLMLYSVFCCYLRDFIEENMYDSRYNVQKTKMLSNQLVQELTKTIDVIFKVPTEEDDKVQITTDYMDAVMFMDKFFRVGQKMQYVEDDKRIELTQKMDKLLEEYGIKF